MPNREQGVAPRNMSATEFARWLSSALEREGYSTDVKRTIEDWLWEHTGRTVLPKVVA